MIAAKEGREMVVCNVVLPEGEQGLVRLSSFKSPRHAFKEARGAVDERR